VNTEDEEDGNASHPVQCGNAMRRQRLALFHAIDLPRRKGSCQAPGSEFGASTMSLRAVTLVRADGSASQRRLPRSLALRRAQGDLSGWCLRQRLLGAP
jgi:hypothetical protein